MKRATDTLLNLAYIYMSYGKARRAVDYLLIARETDPENLQIKKMLAVAFKEINAPSHALTVIADIEAKNADALTALENTTLMLIKSLCRQMAGETEKAKEEFSAYLSVRKELARKEFYASAKASLKNAPKEPRPEPARLTDDMRAFVKTEAGG